MTGGVASWLRILGFSQWLLDETGSPFLVGLIGIVQLVVQLPSTLWAGTLADRNDRKVILAAAHGITFIVLALVAAFNSSNLLTPGFIYLAIAIASGAQTLGGPSRAGAPHGHGKP